MSHCEEPDEAGACTHCGKCGKGRDEAWSRSVLAGRAQDNYLTDQETLRFRAFASPANISGKRLLVLNNTVEPMPPGQGQADAGDGKKIRDLD